MVIAFGIRRFNSKWTVKQSGSNNNHSLGFNASYELGVWGRNRAQNRSGLAPLGGSQFDLDSARLTLIANVASQWLQAVSFRERLSMATLNLSTAERVLAFIEKRARNGTITQL